MGVSAGGVGWWSYGVATPSFQLSWWCCCSWRRRAVMPPLPRRPQTAWPSWGRRYGSSTGYLGGDGSSTCLGRAAEEARKKAAAPALPTARALLQRGHLQQTATAMPMLLSRPPWWVCGGDIGARTGARHLPIFRKSNISKTAGAENRRFVVFV